MTGTSVHLRDRDRVRLGSASAHSREVGGYWVALELGADSVCVHFGTLDQLDQLADAINTASRILRADQEPAPAPEPPPAGIGPEVDLLADIG